MKPFFKTTWVAPLHWLVLGLLGFSAGLAQNDSAEPVNPSTAEPSKSAEVQPVFFVNDQAVMPEDISRLGRGNPLLGLSIAGVVGQDLQNLRLSEAIDAALIRQDSASIEVDEKQVELYLQNFREREKLARDVDYQLRLEQLGFTDADLHQVVRDAFRLDARVANLRAQARVSKAELEWFVGLNINNLKAAGVLEDRVLARQVVLQDLTAAKSLIRKAKAGQDFAGLASASLVGSERGGAVNKDGSLYPGWVTRSAFPKTVAEAVFALGTKSGTGVVGPVRVGQNLYVVSVAKFLPAERTLGVLPAKSRLKLEVQTLPLKQDQVLEDWLDALRQKAVVHFPDAEANGGDFFNPVVASVGDEDLLLSDLNRIVYHNPQVSALLLRSAKGNSELLPQFFKQQALQALLDQRVGAQIAKRERLNVFGPRAAQLEMILRWQNRDVKVSASEIRNYFDDHFGEFIVPANALVLEASFKTTHAASAFREAVISRKGVNFRELASQQNAQAREWGRVTAATLPMEYQGILSGGSKWLSSSRRISKVIVRAGLFRVLLVSDLKAALVPRFKQVKNLANEKALEAKKAETTKRWLATQREVLGSQNHLNDVLAELEQRAKDADSAGIIEPTPPLPLEPDPKPGDGPPTP